MEKILISDVGIAEEIRKQMNVATEEEKGLMSGTDKKRTNQTLLYGYYYNAIKIGKFTSWERASFIIHGIYVQAPFLFVLSMYNVQNDTSNAPKIFITNLSSKIIPFKIYWKKENGYIYIYLVSTANSATSDAENFNILGNKTVERMKFVMDDSYTEIAV